MWRLLSWIGKIAATMWGGPGIVVLGDPGLDAAFPDAAGMRWAYRIAAVTPLVVLVLILIGLAWPIVAIVAAILLLPMVVARILAMRRR
jgi:hypothetical protein